MSDQSRAVRLNWLWDELILACDLLRSNGWKVVRPPDPRLTELSGLLRQLPFYPPEVRPTNFRGEGSVRRKLVNLASSVPGYSGEPTNRGPLDEPMVMAFLEREREMLAAAAAIRAGLATGEFRREEFRVPTSYESDEGVLEGRLLERKHFIRERDRKLRQEKIDCYIDANGGLACEVCGFDYSETYGPHGDGYIECHHVRPLHDSGPTRTRPEDLILICANCHRMIHRRSPWLTPAALRQMLRVGAVGDGSAAAPS